MFDVGFYVVCVEVIEDFLEFIKCCGNDLSIFRLEYLFFGLKLGDCWCLCVFCWKEVFDFGVVLLVVLLVIY